MPIFRPRIVGFSTLDKLLAARLSYVFAAIGFLLFHYRFRYGFFLGWLSAFVLNALVVHYGFPILKALH